MLRHRSQVWSWYLSCFSHWSAGCWSFGHVLKASPVTEPPTPPPESLVIKNLITFKAALCSCLMMETGWSLKFEINPHLSNSVSFANTSAFESRTEISTAYNGFRWINSPPHCIPYKPVCICSTGCIQGAGSVPTHWFIKRRCISNLILILNAEDFSQDSSAWSWIEHLKFIEYLPSSHQRQQKVQV